MSEYEPNKLERMYQILMDMDKPARKRTILWLISKFQIEDIKYQISEPAAYTQPDMEISAHEPLPEVVGFVEILKKNADEKQYILALFACAYLQVEKSIPRSKARDINQVLKAEGFGIKNVSIALHALEKQKPPLVVKITVKKGKKKQQFYKITDEGVKLANAYRIRTGNRKVEQYHNGGLDWARGIQK